MIATEKIQQQQVHRAKENETELRIHSIETFGTHDGPDSH
jgi:hypothetical protein